MDDKNGAAGGQDDSLPAATTNKRTNNTVPTVYPEVDFVNRTLP